MNVDDGSLMTKPHLDRNVVQQHENTTKITTPGGSSKKKKGESSGDEEGGGDDPKSPMKGESSGYNKILPVLTQVGILCVHVFTCMYM